MPGLFGFVQNRERSAAVPLLERMADALEPETRFKRAFHTEDGFGAGRASLAIGDTSRQPVWNAGQTVMLIFAAQEQLKEGLSKTLKAVTAKAAKWPKGELAFKASKE